MPDTDYIEGMGLLAECMQANANHLNSVHQTLIEGLEQDRDRWRERALEAENRLERAQNRLLDLFD